MTNSKLNFRKRITTTKLIVNTLDTGCKSVGEYFCLCRKKGELDTGYHYFITEGGFIEADRNEEAIAGWNLPDNETSIYILVNGKSCSDAQQVSLEELLSTLHNKYKDVKE